MRVFIKNTSKSILLLQNKAKEVFCTLNPGQTSFEAFEEDEIKYNPYLQILLSKKAIILTEDRVEEQKKINQNYGQKYLIGTRCEIKGDHHLVIIIREYIPSTAQYKAELEKTGGIMTLTEKEIIPLTPETIAKENAGADNVDIVVNNEGKVDTKVKSVQEIMKEVENGIPNDMYDTPEVINISEPKPLPQEPDEDEGTYIIRNNNTNEKFAKEIKASKIVNDSMKVVQSAINELANDVTKEVEKKEIDLSKIPANLQNWFVNFINKDQRKQKIAISSCKDIEKLNIIIENCDEYLVNLAKQKLTMLGK